MQFHDVTYLLFTCVYDAISPLRVEPGVAPGTPKHGGETALMGNKVINTSIIN